MKKFVILIIFISNILMGSQFNSMVQQKFLKPSEAFKVEAIDDGKYIKTKIILGEDIHIYQESLKYYISKPTKLELNPDLPEAKNDDGDMIYDGELLVSFLKDNLTKQINGDYTLSIELSGCSSAGICYQPILKSFDFKGIVKVEDKKIKTKTVIEAQDISTIDKISNLANEGSTAKIAEALVSESSFFILFVFFIFGLLLSLTPCIFPMIPILSSIIVSQSAGEKPSVSKAFFTSLIYVLSMAVTYTIVGLIAGLMGADIQASMQNPWVLGLFSIMFVALAFSLFGYYEIGLPSSLQSKITKASDNAQGKGVLGTVIMGLLSALIVGPCVAPPLGGAILFISHTGDALLGGTALFVMSIGMGMPLLLIGVGAGKFMPRPGGWMTKVSEIFGIMMLALAIFMISRVISDGLTMMLWSILFIGTALYFDVFSSQKASGVVGYISRVFAILAMIYGSSLFIGALTGADSIIRPFEKFTSSIPVSSSKENKQSHLGYSIERLEKEIKLSSKPVVIDFGKKSCTACTELEEITFVDLNVIKELKKFTFIKIDLTNNTDEDKEILSKYELFGTPNIIFFDKENNFLKDKTITGFISPKKFLNHLNSLK